MANRPLYTVEGGRQLRATLRQAGDDLTDLKGANQSAADIAASAIRSEAPHVSGALAATIRASGTKTAAIIRAGNNRATASGVKYAGPTNWGWPARGIKENNYMSRGARASEPRWTTVYEAAVLAAIDKIKGI